MRCRGTVTSLREELKTSHDSDHNVVETITVYPTVRFRTGHETREFENPFGANRGKYAVGTTVSVAWNDAGEACIASEAPYQRAFGYVFAGVIAAGGAVYLYITS